MFSQITTILAAKNPETPAAVTTDMAGSSVRISWAQHSEAELNGAKILSYTLKIKEGQGSSIEIIDYTCTPAQLMLRYCDVPMYKLTSDYNYNQGEVIVARVSATNEIGESLFSPANTGPIEAQNVPHQPSSTPIK